MMSDEKQELPQISMDALVAMHEGPQGDLTNEDVAHVAGLFKAVGNELHTVDHNYVGTNSNNQALQLEQQKVFNKPVQADPPAGVLPQQLVPVVPEVNPQKHRVEPIPVVPPPPSVVNSDIEDRLAELERQFNKIIKPPHKKVNVKFKSEHIAAVFDDFEDIVAAVRKSLNKSSKRITITLNEN
jgi:glutaredoxin 2